MTMREQGEIALSADFTKTCKGCKHVRRERVLKAGTVYRCFAEGPKIGRTVGDGRQFLPYVPAWCPEKMKGAENYGPKKKG